MSLAARRMLYARKPANYPARWGLVEHWKLDEASGVALPSYGTNTLTDNNTVTSNARLPGLGGVQAAQFTAANSEYLSIADNAALSTGDVDFWLAAWVYIDSKADRHIAGKYLTGTNNREYRLNLGAAPDLFSVNVSANGVIGVGVPASTFGAPALATWHFVIAYHDCVNNTINISVNGGAFDSAAHTTGVLDGAAPFTIGSLGDGTSQLWDGRIGPVSFGKSPPGGIAAIATTIRDRLYNGGGPVLYSGLSSAEKTDWGLVAHWNLNESSGQRNDSHSTNHLTDNNTVTAQAAKGSTLARQFTAANSEYLSVADNAALSVADLDFWVSGWIYLDSLGATRRLAGQWAIAAGDLSWVLSLLTGNTLRFTVSADGSAAVNVDDATVLTTATWYFFIIWHDNVANTINISVNNNTPTNAAHTTGVRDSALAFNVGSRNGSDQFWDGRIGPVAFGKSPPGGIAALATEIRARLWNGGSGRGFPWR